jgi:hypothetical protein
MANTAGVYGGLHLDVLERLVLWEMGQVSGTTVSYSVYPKWLIRQKLNDRQNAFVQETHCLRRMALIPMIAGQRLYRLPANCIDDGVINAKFFSSSTVYVDLDVRDIDWLDANRNGWLTAENSDPELVYHGGSYGSIPLIGVYPPPDTTGTAYATGDDTGIAVSTALGTTQQSIYGTATAGSSTTCQDSATTFTDYGLAAGMWIRNITDGCYGLITGVATNTITCAAGFTGGTLNTFQAGDLYVVLAGEYAVRVDHEREVYIYGYRHGALGDITVPASTLLIEYVPFPVQFKWDETAADASQGNDYTYPEIPRNYHKALYWGVVSDLLRTFNQASKEFERAVYYEELYQSAVSQAKEKKDRRPFKEKIVSISPLKR